MADKDLVLDNPITSHHKNNVSKGTSVKNEDGTVSTIRTIIVGDGEYEYLIPTVWEGEILSDEEAFDRAMSSGVDWPKATSGEVGVNALKDLDKMIHDDINKEEYAEGGVVRGNKVPKTKIDFFSLPQSADPENDPIIGIDEAGDVVKESLLGVRYAIKPKAQETRKSKSGSLDRVKEVGEEALLGFVEGVSSAVSAPRRALEGEAVTVGDAIGTAAMGSGVGSVGKAPKGSLRSMVGRDSETEWFSEDALRTAANQNDKSREILVDMPIEDFLKAAEKDFSSEKLEKTRQLVSEGKPFDSVPTLSFKNNADGTGKVTGHDGRHRALALKEQGETTIPVRLISQSGDGPGIRWGQQGNPKSFDYVDVIPQKLIEQDGTDFVRMPEKAANIRPTETLSEETNKYNEGGAVPMEKQMSLFDEGGMADDGMDVDPVSGNEVPPGSMAEEVRDDVDAKLSSGEYVVPADVVQYFGLKFFENLRSEAKGDLDKMDKEGRIGGQPSGEAGMGGEEELSPEEMAMLQEIMGGDQGAPMQMAEGGTVEMPKTPTLPQSTFKPTDWSTVGGSYSPSQGLSADSGRATYKTYVGPSGETVLILFVGGKPNTPIPEGFTLKETAAEKQQEKTPEEIAAEEKELMELANRGPAEEGSDEPSQSWGEANFDAISKDPIGFGMDALSGVGKGVMGAVSNVGLVGKALAGLSDTTDIASAKGAAIAAEKAGLDTTGLNAAIAEAEDKVGFASDIAEYFGVGDGSRNYKSFEEAQETYSDKTQSKAKASTTTGVTATTPTATPATGASDSESAPSSSPSGEDETGGGQFAKGGFVKKPTPKKTTKKKTTPKKKGLASK